MISGDLKSCLADWTGPPEAPAHFEPRRTRRASRRVARQLGGIAAMAPATFELDSLHRSVAHAWQQDHSLESLSRRTLRRVPWVFFYPYANASANASWLGADPGLVSAYGRWLTQHNHSSAARVLLHVFLRYYPARISSFTSLRAILESIFMRNDSERRRSLRLWSERCQEFQLLADDGAQSFARQLVDSEQACDEFLERAGFTEQLASCAFLKIGIMRYLKEVRSLLEKKTLDARAVDRVLILLTIGSKLRFEDLAVRKSIAANLLGPFVQVEAANPIQFRLKRFFSQYYGDPRLPSGKGNWFGISRDARSVVMRWFIKDTLDAFFRLIKETALDRHWRYREAFWRALLNQGYILDAWFALGSRAQHLSKLQSDTYGLLHGGSRDQSALLISLDGVTVVEWSHNGACRFWLTRNRAAPKLHEAEYRKYDLMDSPDWYQNHHGSDRGWWQDKIADWLNYQVGIRLSRRDYYPRKLRSKRS